MLMGARYIYQQKENQQQLQHESAFGNYTRLKFHIKTIHISKRTLDGIRHKIKIKIHAKTIHITKRRLDSIDSFHTTHTCTDTHMHRRTHTHTHEQSHTHASMHTRTCTHKP